MSRAVEPATAGSATTAVVRSDRDCVIAIVANVVLLVVIDVWPTWRALPFVTEDAIIAAALISVAAGSAIVLNALGLVAHRTWLRALTDAIGSAFGLGLVVLLWHTFPFVLPAGTSDWMLLARLALAFGVILFGVTLAAQTVLVLIKISAASDGAAQQ